MPLPEQYSNNPGNSLSSTLASGIIAGDTSLSVSSATQFPTTGQFRILIDSEIILVGAVSGTTFSSLVRGAEGTTAASHSSGVVVSMVLTRDGLVGVGGSVNLSDSYSLIPSSSVVGRTYYPSDGAHVLRDNGTAWQAFGPAYPMTPPDSSAFSWVNQNTATVTQAGSVVFLSSAIVGSISLNCRVQSAPTTPYSVTAFMRTDLGPTGNNQFGVGWRESSSGKLVTLDYVWNSGTPIWQVNKWNSATSFNSGYSVSPNNANQLSASAGIFFKIRDDGTNRTVGYSLDGQNFVTLHTVGRTDFITADQVLFMIDPQDSFLHLTLFGWTVTP